MNGVLYVHKYKRWARKGHMVSMRQLFMRFWGRGEKNRAEYRDPRPVFLFIIF